MMVLLGRLYDIERKAKDQKYNSAQLLEARQNEAKLILAEIKLMLDEYKMQVLPKSPISKELGKAAKESRKYRRRTRRLIFYNGVVSREVTNHLPMA